MALAPVKSKILVIEDQPEVLDLMSRLLRRAGYEVAAARTGLEGIRLTHNEEFDLITVDIDLPDMSGFDVCIYLKQDFRFCRTPLIFVSGRLGEEDQRRGVAVGAADFIVKPFDPPAFISRVASHVKPVRNPKPPRPERGNPV